MKEIIKYFYIEMKTMQRSLKIKNLNKKYDNRKISKQLCHKYFIFKPKLKRHAYYLFYLNL